MKKAVPYLAAVFVLILTTALYAQYSTPFRSDSEAHQVGYDEGYRHGMADRDLGLDMNFRHIHRGSWLNYDSYVNTAYRSGYVQGFTDGYYNRSAERRSVERSPRYSDSEGYVRPSRGVTVYTDTRFSGSARTFGIGEFPYMAGTWNDSISSVELHGPVRVTLFDDSDFRGPSLIVERSTSDLFEFNFGARAASMIVEPLD